MALKILKADEPLNIERITVAIYGQPGVGKTTLAFTAESPILFDFDNGAYRAVGRKDTVQISGWEDVSEITKADLQPYKTVIVDTAGRALDALAMDIMRREPKLGRNGALSQQGWGRLKAEFTAWLKLLHSFGKDVVLIAHGTEKQDGEETTVRLDVQGGSKDEIYKSADVMGRLFIRGGKRILAFDPTDTAYGKNPGSIAQSEFCDGDDGLISRIIADTKKAINTKSAESKAEYERVERLKDDLYALDGVDDFNRVMGDMAASLPKDKMLLLSVAQSKGFSFDRGQKTFLAAA